MKKILLIIGLLFFSSVAVAEDYYFCACNYECNEAQISFRTKKKSCDKTTEAKFYQLDNNYAKGYRCKLSKTEICIDPMAGFSRSTGR